MAIARSGLSEAMDGLSRPVGNRLDEQSGACWNMWLSTSSVDDFAAPRA
jgi:hypothetical protein